MKKIYLLGGFFIIILITLLSSIFTVDQRQYAIIFQFGEAVRIIDTAGLKSKIPIIQNVNYFEKRLIEVAAEAKELTASDEKRIIVDAFAKYKIIDPVKFYKTVANYTGIKIRLNRALESAMRRVIGRVPLLTLLSVERSNIMKEIRKLVNEEALLFGVEVVDVRILRADLPPENSEAIYKRMSTDREKEAMQIRAEGREESDRIKSQASKEKQILLADAYKQAEIIKGEGEAKAAAIYNATYSTDSEFYSYYRSLQVYKSSFNSTNTNFILNSGSDMLKYLRLTK